MARLLNSIQKEWGLRLNGSSQYVTYPFIAAYDNITTTLTMSAWVKITPPLTFCVIMCHSGGNGYEMEIENDGKIYLYTSGGGYAGITNKGVFPIDNKWHHVAVTQSGVGAGTVAIYLDGQSITLLTNSGQTYIANGGAITIGRRAAGSYLNGSVKDARLYSTALTVSQIRTMYEQGPNTSLGTPTLWAKLNEGTSTSCADSSANANTGTITGRTTTGATPSTMWVIDPVRPPRLASTSNTTSVLFNGMSDKVVVADNAALNMGTGDFTVECKMFFSHSSVDAYLVNKFATGSGIGWQLFLRGSTFGGKIGFYFGTPTSAYSIYNGLISSGRWYHVIVSVNRDSQENFRMFVNGGYDSTYSADIATIPDTISNTATLDFMERGGSAFSKGGMYDVRLYNRALTDNECLSRYYTNENITSGRVGWWKMDEGSGTNIADSQGSNTGTLTGGAWKLNTQS